MTRYQTAKIIKLREAGAERLAALNLPASVEFFTHILRRCNGDIELSVAALCSEHSEAASHLPAFIFTIRKDGTALGRKNYCPLNPETRDLPITYFVEADTDTHFQF